MKKWLMCFIRGHSKDPKVIVFKGYQIMRCAHCDAHLQTVHYTGE